MKKITITKERIDSMMLKELELADVDPNFYERSYPDGADELYICHFIENVEKLGFHEDVSFEVIYEEKDHVIKVRENLFEGVGHEDDLIDAVGTSYEDQFNYDKVVGYRVNNGDVHWL